MQGTTARIKRHLYSGLSKKIEKFFEAEIFMEQPTISAKIITAVKIYFGFNL